MTEATVLSTEELVQLLKEGKVDEFNQCRPESGGEFSPRRDRQAEATFGVDASPNAFRDYIRHEGSIPELLHFDGADLSNLDLTKANLSGIDFSEVNFSGANLTDTNLSNCDFHLANLSGAKISGAEVWGASFWEANLTGVDFSKVHCVDHAHFEDAFGLSEEQQQVILAALKATWTNRHFHWNKQD